MAARRSRKCPEAERDLLRQGQCPGLHQTAVGVPYSSMESAAPNVDVTIGEARQALAAMVFTELELGLTFLDVAATTTNGRHVHRSVSNAITALRTADRLLSMLSPETIELEALRQRRERLAVRLRDFWCSRIGKVDAA